PKERVPGIVRIIGADNLRADKPELAEAIMRLLVARRTDASFANVQYVFDFEAKVTAQDKRGDVQERLRNLLIGAVGVAGTRTLGATATFKNLDVAEMKQHADSLLDALKQAPWLGERAIEFEPAALDLLYEA